MILFYITNTRLPTERAHGIQIMNVCSALAKEGLDLTLLVPNRRNKIKQDPFKYFDLENNFRIKKLFTLDLFKYEKYLGRIIFWFQISSFYLICFFYLLLKNRKIILYTRDNLGFIMSFLGFKVFYECHTIPETKQKIFFRFLRKFKGIVVINSNIKKRLLKVGFPAEQILTAPDGVDLKKFSIQLEKKTARLKLGLDLNQKIILYSGHLYKWKGADILAQTAKDLDEAVVYLVGGLADNLKTFTDNYAAAIKNNKMFLLGHQKYSTIPLWLKSADVLVLPNSASEDISKFYTSPLKLLFVRTHFD